MITKLQSADSERFDKEEEFDRDSEISLEKGNRLDFRHGLRVARNCTGGQEMG